MTNQTLTSLILRIAGIYSFTKIFDYFGTYFVSLYGTAILTTVNKNLNDPVTNFYLTGTFLIFANIIVSLLLFIKADWISKKLTKKEIEIKTELNAKSLTKVILLTVGVIWLAKLIYQIPYLFDHCAKLISKLNENKKIEFFDLDFISYFLRTILTFIIIFRIEKISNWILKKI